MLLLLEFKMTNQHPITPPPDLVEEWLRKWENRIKINGFLPSISNWSDEARYQWFAKTAAQWGADQELEACCEWFVCDWADDETADALRNARRPKPLSLKEQALATLDDCSDRLDGAHENTIRRALEALPNDIK
jgi:hypothetical protein